MKINVVIEVPENWSECLDMQPTIEAEISADRWAWNYADESNSSFGAAVELLKKGIKVARSGWNEKGMWLLLVSSRSDDLANDCHAIALLESLPWIAMKTADNKFVPWVASQIDVLAEDWQVVE